VKTKTINNNVKRKYDTVHRKQGNDLLLKLFLMIITMASLQGEAVLALEIFPTTTSANGKYRCN